MQRTLMAMLLLLMGCSEQIEVAMFNYQACRRQMTEEFIQLGTQPVAANMQAKAYCQAQQDEAKGQ